MRATDRSLAGDPLTKTTQHSTSSSIPRMMIRHGLSSGSVAEQREHRDDYLGTDRGGRPAPDDQRTFRRRRSLLRLQLGARWPRRWQRSCGSSSPPPRNRESGASDTP